MKKIFILPSTFDPWSWDNWTPAPNDLWERTYDPNETDIHLGIDTLTFDWSKPIKKLVLLSEPVGIIPSNYKIFEDNIICHFDVVATHHLRFLGKKNVIGINPPVGTSIDNKQIYQKHKLCSIVTSLKNTAPGHKKRHEILNNFSYIGLEKYGVPFNPIKDKTDGLKDYAFSFAIENCSERGYYTEKLLDCFLTGTIPIYWGDPGIETIFDKNGIIFYDEGFNYSDLSMELYYSKYNSIVTNFLIAQKLLETNSIEHALKTTIQAALQ